MDLALLSVLRDGLLRRSEAAALTWGDLELRDNGTALINIPRSKTDQEGEGVTLYIGPHAGEALQAIRPADELLDRNASVFGMITRNIGKRVTAAAKTASLGGGFTGHSGRVGMAQDLVKSGVELPALMTTGRWKSSKMPARHTER
ncbi:MAG: tyrosine-type recombinase/integrase [Chloroflexi bacterium]|nr:tyrosine-type recombinase/integrase [Chloroflexota bacterium]